MDLCGKPFVGGNLGAGSLLPSCLGFRTDAVWVRESRNCQIGLDKIDASNILPNILISRHFVDVLYHAFDIHPLSVLDALYLAVGGVGDLQRLAAFTRMSFCVNVSGP